MSTWSSAEGTITINNSEHFSLKKYTTSLSDETTSTISYGDEDNGVRTDKFALSVCYDGQAAMNFFIQWMEGIPGSVDMSVHLRMLK